MSAKHTTYDEKHLKPKLNAWNSWIRDEGFSRFDCHMMAFISVIRKKTCFSSNPKSVLSSMRRLTKVSGSNISFDNYNIAYGFVQKLDILRGLLVLSPATKFDQRIEDEMRELGLLEKLERVSSNMQKHATHDFVHNATFAAPMASNLWFQVHNRKGTINGYEHYSLATHQAIYVHMRETNLAYVNEVYEAACDFGDVIEEYAKRSKNPQKAAIRIALYEFLYYMLGNFVCGSEFIGNDGSFVVDRANWLKALIIGKPTPFIPFRVLDAEGKEKEVSLAELNYIFFQQLIALDIIEVELIRTPPSTFISGNAINLEVDLTQGWYLKNLLNEKNNKNSANLLKFVR